MYVGRLLASVGRRCENFFDLYIDTEESTTTLPLRVWNPPCPLLRLATKLTPAIPDLNRDYNIIVVFILKIE